MTYDFEVGDKVECIEGTQRGRAVIKFIENENLIAIEFFRKNQFLHDCEGHTKNEHGWWVSSEDIKIIKRAKPELFD